VTVCVIQLTVVTEITLRYWLTTKCNDRSNKLTWLAINIGVFMLAPTYPH
jgi:hypothetical protein